MFNYKTLENTGIEVLHQTFIEAFSDYQVKTELPLWKFEGMLKRRGYDPKISIGAFENSALVGFILNAFRNWDGKPTAYDTGTGVISEYRRQGITSRMILNAKGLFKEKGIKQYLLEAIKSNTRAVRLYEKQGFEIKRNLLCFQMDKNKYNPAAGFKVEHIQKIDPVDWKQLMTFWDFVPSWQNSIDSIDAVYDMFIYSIVRLEGMIVGYGIIDKNTGDIPQIAVGKDYRHIGIASAIISDLMENTKSDNISILNIDSQSETLKHFLLKSGFKNHVDQYEMVLKL